MNRPTDADSVPYATRETDRVRPAFFVQGWIACVAAMLFCGGAAVYVVNDRRWFTQVVTDFRLKLSPLTQWMIELPTYLILGFGVATMGGLLVVQLIWRNKHTATVLHLLAVVFWCVVILAYRELMWDAISSLFQGMIGGGRRGTPHP